MLRRCARCGCCWPRWLLGRRWRPAWAQDVLPVPALTARVIDQTGTLDAAQRGALEAKLAAFEQAAGPQIVVLMVPTHAAGGHQPPTRSAWPTAGRSAAARSATAC